MSVDSYRAAVERLRGVLGMLGPFRGPCLCGHPDARHRDADAIADRLVAGDDPGDVAGDFLRPDVDAATGALLVLRVGVAVLGADPRRHGVTRGRAAGVDREVWAEPG